MGAIIISILQMRRRQFRELNWFASSLRNKVETWTSDDQSLMQTCEGSREWEVQQCFHSALGLFSPPARSPPWVSARLFLPLLGLPISWLPLLPFLLLKQDCAQGFALALLLANVPPRRVFTHTIRVYLPSLCLYLQTIISTCLRDISTWTSCWYLKANTSQAKYIIFLLIISFFFFFPCSNNTHPKLPIPYSQNLEKALVPFSPLLPVSSKYNILLFWLRLPSYSSVAHHFFPQRSLNWHPTSSFVPLLTVWPIIFIQCGMHTETYVS